MILLKESTKEASTDCGCVRYVCSSESVRDWIKKRGIVVFIEPTNAFVS